jgi:hypothetical protein
MKSPLLIGLLALAITGVSAYDYYFFTHDHDGGQPSTQAAPNAPLIQSAAPVEPAPSETGEPEGTITSSSLPPISRDEVQRLAQQRFVSREDEGSNTEAAWPQRDPFAISRESAPVRQNAQAFQNEPVWQNASASHSASAVPAKEASAPQPLPAPDCVFSGTLIDDDQRLALVNGAPLSVGDRVGAWQLARIEPDYIILEAGKETRRIELAGSEPQTSRRKGSL